jgi:hypothetical protein
MSFEHRSLGCSFPRASAFCGMSAIDALRTIPPHLRCPSEAEPRRRNIALVNWPAAPRTRRAGAAVARKGSRSGRDVSRRKETGRGGSAGGRCRSLAGSPSQETSHARTTRRCRDSQVPRARDGGRCRGPRAKCSSPIASTTCPTARLRSEPGLSVQHVDRHMTRAIVAIDQALARPPLRWWERLLGW